jgi:hypothetical protein
VRHSEVRNRTALIGRGQLPPIAGFVHVPMGHNLIDLARDLARHLQACLEGYGVEWKGWYSFRRGLGMNLYRLGVPDKVIQAILW